MGWHRFSYFMISGLFFSVYGQIHFYQTDRSTIHRSPVYYDCLYYTVLENIVDYSEYFEVSFNPTHQVIPYCVRPVNEKLNVENKPMNVTGVTFGYLRQKGINVSTLLSWSAPIDLVEQYQEYLSDPLNKNSSTLFYNCTWPWFGSTCQYSFRVDLRRLKSIVRSMFWTKILQDGILLGSYPTNYTNLSCYTHLNCTYKGLPLCLDWREICDGEVNCYDDGIDEMNCFQLEAHECNADEFQCGNGMCIPIDFFNDSPFNYDCIDGTDEGDLNRAKATMYESSPCFLDPAFRCEELSYMSTLPHFFCGDGETIGGAYCRNGRHILKDRDLWFYENNQNLTYDCWLVFYCATYRLEEQSPVDCSIFCDEIKRTCRFDIKSKCSPRYVIYPQTPIYDGHVYEMYLTNRIHSYKTRSRKLLSSDYLCYDRTRCPYFSDIFHIDGLTCLKTHTAETQIFLGTATFQHIFRSCLTIDPSGNETHCRHPSHFHCPNTSKCISKQRLVDGKVDCHNGIDEFFENSCQLEGAKYRFQCSSQQKCIPWRSVLDKVWDCIEAEDELRDLTAAESTANSFQITCDGFQHVRATLIGNRNETDETSCEDWPCSNIYTRGDHTVTCLNGEDEIDQQVDWIMLSDCPINSYPCISPRNLSLFCLPYSQLNDTIIDCLGALDEQLHCRGESSRSGNDLSHLYRCWNDTTCTLPDLDSIQTACDFDRKLLSHVDLSHISVALELFSINRVFLSAKSDPIVFFILMQSNQYPSSSSKTSLSSPDQPTTLPSIVDEAISEDIIFKEAWWCNRGLTIRHGSMRTVRCLCPPSYYGNRCQYQSQRVSLTLQFQPVCSPECQGLYIILVSLLDQQGLVHSQEIFTYTPEHNCRTKFNLNLLYRNRPKDETISYHLRVEAYNRSSQPLTYTTNWHLSIPFSFLPVNRVAALLTFPKDPPTELCTQFCGNGQCTVYANAKQLTYCRCQPGWTGVNCTMPYDCRCSSDALCVGLSSNRSICLCPVNRFGPRCLLPSICETKNPCRNGGSCTPNDADPDRFTCRCRSEYAGVQCEKINNELIVSFNRIDIPQSMLVYFVTVRDSRNPTFTVLSTRIPYDKDQIVLYFSQSFHLVLSQLYHDYYLIVLQENATTSTSIRTEISPSRRCPSTRELLTVHWPLLRRMKMYHKICRDRLELSCFHDNETFMCLCTNERHANCFEFDFNQQAHQCKSLHDCQHNASCFQDRPCPTSVMCICPECYYGSKCQFTTESFGLNLDTILSYQIHPNVPLHRQPKSTQFSFIITLVMFFFGILSGLISLLTFRSPKLREIGCGNYLYVSSITILLLMTVFLFKYLFLLLTQMSLITDRTFLWFNCITMDYLLRSFLAMSDWFNACVAIERVCAAIRGVHFDGRKSKSVSRWIVLLVMTMICVSLIHDPIHRRLIDDTEEKRTWCMMKYSYNAFQIYNSIINIFHFYVPFSMNIISSAVIIIAVAGKRSAVRQQASYKHHLREQCITHKHLLISPFVLILLSLPRLILSFLSGCMKSLRDPWLYLIGYLISFVPPLLHVFIFIVPSKTYRNELLKVIRRICRSRR